MPAGEFWRLMTSQIEFWRSGIRTTNDYHVIEKMDYTVDDQAKEDFLPFGLDGVVFDDIVAGQLRNEEENYITLLTGYGTAQCLHEQLGCEAHLNDLTLRACEETSDGIVAKDKRDYVILDHECREPEFSSTEVYDAFYNACDIYTAVMRKHVVKRDIGYRVQATIVARLAFSVETGSCTNRRSHRTNLLGIIQLILKGKNWVQPTGELGVTNEIQKVRPPYEEGEGKSNDEHSKVKFIMVYAYRGASRLKQLVKRLSRYPEGGVENRARKQASNCSGSTLSI
uniref:Uncharacterized protein n=1 Tax=Glossina palpalis gambiensis TaxID=67801 RepID=A0A1B0BGC8_9MUSC